MKASTFLKLGRVSNLPTVWTNTVAGAALAGAWPLDARIVPLILAMTLAYVGGMFLNDAFDHEIDAKERPERPIPSGEIARTTVQILAAIMLVLAVLLVAWCALGTRGGGLSGVIAALALVASIVIYNLWHKGNPLSPVLMGMCRLLVYVTAGHALVEEPSAAMYIGALVLLGYLIGLTYTAKQESLGKVSNLWPLALLAAPLLYGLNAALDNNGVWLPALLLGLWIVMALSLVRRRQPGDIPMAVGYMIAGISLIDAVFLATAAGLVPALGAVAAFLLTLFLQRYVAAT